jgi:hypothetical protein
VPIAKGLKLGKTTCRLLEKLDITWKNKSGTKTESNFLESSVANDEWTPPADFETTELENGDMAWVFTRRVQIPQQLRRCQVTVNALGIKISFRVMFVVELLNLAGHTSEVCPCSKFTQQRI